MDDLSTPERYYEAAWERFNDAVHLQGEERWSGAVYFAGCAIESMLWAFISKGEVGERGRHSLLHLYNAGLGAKFDAIYREKYRSGSIAPTRKLENFEKRDREISRQLNIAITHWRNVYRYYPNSAYDIILKQNRSLGRAAKGLWLKVYVNDLMSSAQYFMGLGEERRNWIL